MGIRCELVAVKSIKQIQDVITSKNAELLEDFLREEEAESRKTFSEPMDDIDLEEFNELLADKREQFSRFLISDDPAYEEPGSTIFFIDYVISRYDLEIEVNLEFNVGYDPTVWSAYQNLISKLVRADAHELIGHLEARPFRGAVVEFDGSIYGWLTNTELSKLLNALGELKANEMARQVLETSDLAIFHEALVSALATCKQLGCDMIVKAS